MVARIYPEVSRILPGALPNLWPFLNAIAALSFYRLASEAPRAFASVAIAGYFSGRVGGAVSASIFFVLVLAETSSRTNLASILNLFALAHWLGTTLALLVIVAYGMRPRLPAPSMVRTLFVKGIWITLNQVVVVINVSLDMWFLGVLGNPSIVAVYGLAKKISLWLAATHGIVADSSMRQASDYFRDGKVAKLESAYRFVVSLAWVVVFAFALLSPIVGVCVCKITNLAGCSELPAFLGLLSLLVAANVYFGNAGSILLATGHETSNISVTLCVCLLMLVVGWLSIPWAGAYGAAITYGSGVVVSSYFLGLAVRRHLGIRVDVSLALLLCKARELAGRRTY
jgi:O-antigen/teichoic acid export membrane protein